ncbi:hypothetical protein PFISCL1PPCAC_24442, partial [Pristionchus fissidentatus]
STTNLTVGLSALRNLPRARPEVLKQYEESKRRFEEIRHDRVDNGATPSRSSGSSLSDRSSTSLDSRSPRQPAGREDNVSQSSTSQTHSVHATSPFYEGAMSALSDTILMGTPYEPIHWPKVPEAPTPQLDDEPKKAPSYTALKWELPSSTVFAVKGACTTQLAEDRTATSSECSSMTTVKSNRVTSAISPIVQRRIEMKDNEERKKRKEEEGRKKREDEARRKNEEEERRRKTIEEKKRREKEGENERRKIEDEERKK